MKISFINWGLTKQPRGMERVGVMLANEMVERGHSVEILVFDPEKRPSVFPLEKEVELYYIEHLAHQESRENTLQHLQERGTDVVVSMFSWFGMLFPSEMLLNSNIPYIISEHNSPELIISRWNKEERLAAMSIADRIHMLMPEYRDSLPESIRQRVCVIPNAVDPATQYASPAGSKGDKKTILVVSSFMETSKQLSMLVRAFSLITEQFPEWQVRIFGGGDDIDIVKTLVTEHGLENSFLLCGHTNDLEAEYVSSHLFCLPSKYEGCPCALQEAQAHGLPAVGFADCPGTNHLIKHKSNGLLANDMTPECLADTLKILLADDQMRMQYGKTAIEDSFEYKTERVFDQWETLLKATISLRQETIRSDINPYSTDSRWRAELLRLSNRPLSALPTDQKRNINNPRVSVIVPVYNVSAYLFECLDSVRNQTLRDIEIICIEDASTDNSADVLHRISKEDDRIIIAKHEENRGLAAARNTGLELAKGDFIYFLDSDDFLAREDSIETLYIAAIEDFSDVAIGGVMRWNAQTGKREPGWHGKYMSEEVHGKTLDKLPQLKSNVVAWNKMIRRSLLDKNDIRFDESLRKHEDDPFTCKVHVLAKRLSIRPVATYIYRQGRTDSIMATIDKEDIFYVNKVCCKIFKFIESDPEYFKYRKHFYQMYSPRLLQNVELLSRHDPSQQDKDRLWDLMQTASSYLPDDLPGVENNKKQAYKEIKSNRRVIAWSSAIKFSCTRPLASSNNKIDPEIANKLRSGVKTHRLLSEQISSITHSRSWKLTASLRNLSTWLKG